MKKRLGKHRFKFIKRGQLFIGALTRRFPSLCASALLLIVQNRLRCRLIQFELRAHFLNLRGLFFQACRLLVKHIRGKRESPLQFQARFFDCLQRSDGILSQ